jgi:hypothetical protein
MNIHLLAGTIDPVYCQKVTLEPEAATPGVQEVLFQVSLLHRRRGKQIHLHTIHHQLKQMIPSSVSGLPLALRGPQKH